MSFFVSSTSDAPGRGISSFYLLPVVTPLTRATLSLPDLTPSAGVSWSARNYAYYPIA